MSETLTSPAAEPRIKTALPGPKAQALLARDAAVVSPSYPRDYPFVMSHGRGCEAWDVDGNRFLDFAAGIAVCTTGHAHPRWSRRSRPRPTTSCTARRLLARAPGGAGREDRGAGALRRAGDELLLPVGHRGGGGRAEARPLRHRPAAVHRLPRRIPRPDHGLARLHLEQVHPAGGLLPRHAGGDPGPLPQPLPAAVRRRGPGQGRARLHRDAVRLDPAAEGGGRGADRADPGRGRLPGAARRLPRRPSRALRPARHPADLRRGAVGHGPHGQDLRRRAFRRASRHHHPGQGPGLGHADRPGGRQAGDHEPAGRRAPTATPSAATRSAAPPPSPLSTWSPAGSPPTPRGWASIS